jgi:alpha-L-arabinofuranosidase
VQQLFSLNAGDVYIPISVNLEDNKNVIAVSCVQDSKSDDLVVKIVSRADLPVQAQIHLNSDLAFEPWASCTVLSGDPLTKNAFGKQADVLPKTSVIMGKEYFTFEIPAHSLSVIRMKSRKS